jgi:hypothetical protein
MPERPELVLGNPPFSQGLEHIEKAFTVAGRSVGFVLPLAFMAGQTRYTRIWKPTPLGEMAWRPRVMMVISERQSFSGDGGTLPTDQAFFLWERSAWGSCETRWLEPEALQAANEWVLTGERPKRWTWSAPPAGHIDDPRGRCA